LGKVPVLGYLFRSKSNSKTKRNLLVFLQPQILRDSESALAISAGKYNLTRGLQLRVGARGELMQLPESINQVYQGTAPAKP
jgi:general secretion pathway protein D